MGKKRKKPTVLQFFALNIFAVSLIFMGIFYFIWIKYEHRRFNKAVAVSKKIYINSKKQALKTIVEQFYNHLILNIKYKRDVLERQIDILVYSSPLSRNQKELKKLCFMVRENTPVINFAFFKKGRLVFSSMPVELSFFNSQDNFEIKKKILLPNTDGFLFLFVLRRDFQDFIKKDLFLLFKDISFNYSGYLFIVDIDGTVLLSAHKLMNKKISDMSEDFGKQTEKILLDAAKTKGSTFVEYTWFKPDLQTVSKKISYIKYNPRLHWIIGAGIYLDDIEKSFLPIYHISRQDFFSNIVKVSFLMFVILMLDLGLLFMLIGDRIQSDFNNINKLFDNFDNFTSAEIEEFECSSLNFREACFFAENVKKSLLDIKKKSNELEQTNLLLEESKEKFVRLARSINSGVIVFDENLKVEFANKKFCDIFACSPDFVQEANFLQFFPDKDKRSITMVVERFLSLGEGSIKPQVKKILINGMEKIIEISFTKFRVKNRDRIICTITDITENQKVLEHLRFLTAQFEKAEDMAKVGNWIYYPEKKKFWASKEAFKIYDIDFTDDGMIDISVVNSRILEDDRGIAFKTTMVPLKYKKMFEGNFRVKDRKGNIKNIVSRGEPILDSKGRVIRVEGVLKDITDLKVVEEKLKQQIELLERTQSIAQLGYWEYSFNSGMFKLTSSFFTDVLGRDVLSIEDVLAIVIKEDRERVRNFIYKEFEREEVIAGSFRVRLPGSKSEHYLYFESDRKFKENGKFKRSGWLQDITRLKRLEEKIEIEKDKLLNTINALSEGVALLDGEFNIVFVNESFMRIFKQYSIRESNIISLLNSLNIEGLGKDITQKNFLNFAGRNKKYRILFEDAEIIVSFDIRKLKKSLDFAGYVFVVEDITHKEKFTEEVIKTQNMKLLNKVAASLAHDLNNLLGSILGKVSILEKEARDAKMARDMAKIMRNINIARALATQFLTFSKSGKPLIRNIEKSTLRQVIDDLADFVFSGTSIEVKIDIEDNLFAIKGDRIQIAQIILNLFSNARDVLKNEGKIEVRVSSVENAIPTPHCGKGDYVLIKISDNGPGIPEDKLKSIFEFFVGYKKEGFGLGLAIVKNIIDSHGGCLDVESEEGKGTSFYIYLPAVKVEREEVKKDKSGKEVEVKTEKVSLSFLKVAILEDEVPMQETIYDLMDFLGVNCDIFARGEDLVEAVKNAVEKGERYHIAILDLTVKGGMGGKEVIGKLKQIDSSIVAVVSSGYARDDIVSKYYEFGFDGALPKPYSLDELEVLLKNIAKKIRDA